MRTDASRARWRWAALLRIPTTYGVASWAVWTIAYFLPLSDWEPASTETLITFVGVVAVLLVATVRALPAFEALATNQASGAEPPASCNRGLLVLLHAVGLAGVALYVWDFAVVMGGVGNFFTILLSDSRIIRADLVGATTVGNQVSYFGWIAAACTTYHLAEGRLARSWWSLVALQLAGNFLWVARTRPMWIAFSCALVYLHANRGRVTSARIAKWSALSIGASIALFVGVAQWVGKTYEAGRFDRFGASALSGPAHLIYFYGTQGLAYFNRLIADGEPPSYAPLRTCYPIYKMLASAGLADPPPPEVLEPWFLPFPSNVGTFLEPMYRDGGVVALVAGVLICSFGFNRLSLRLLRSRSPAACMAWSHLCFALFISTFVPKHGSAPFWLLISVGVGGALLATLRRTRDLEAPLLAPGPAAMPPCPARAPRGLGREDR